MPNGCSAVSRRWRMACGFLSRRFWTASSTCSCSQRMARAGVIRIRRRPILITLKLTLNVADGSKADALRLPCQAEAACKRGALVNGEPTWISSFALRTLRATVVFLSA